MPQGFQFIHITPLTSYSVLFFLLNTLPLIKSISVHVSVYQIFVLDCVEYLCFIPSNHQRTVKMSSVSRFLC